MELIPKPETFPSALTVVVGSLSGSLSDIQSKYEGNSIDITEAATTPGIHVELEIANILHFSSVTLVGYYAGGASHYVQVQLWNKNTNSWNTLGTLQLGVSAISITYPITDDTCNAYIFNNKVRVRLYHPSNGSVSHHLFIDYIALER